MIQTFNILDNKDVTLENHQYYIYGIFLKQHSL